jgi:hypothetical protein
MEGWVQVLCSAQLTLRPDSLQQQAEVALVSQTQEEKLAATLRIELHNTSCQVQSLQAETESLQALVSGPTGALESLVPILMLNSNSSHLRVIVCKGLSFHRI